MTDERFSRGLAFLCAIMGLVLVFVPGSDDRATLCLAIGTFLWLMADREERRK